MSETTYPCADCGVPRTKAEGGTTFTVCDDCWEKHYSRANLRAMVPPPPDTAEAEAPSVRPLLDGLVALGARHRAPPPDTAAAPTTDLVEPMADCDDATYLDAVADEGLALNLTTAEAAARLHRIAAGLRSPAPATDDAPTEAHDAARYRFLRDNPLQLRAIDGASAFWGNVPAEHIDRWTDAAMENAGAPTPTED